MALNKAIKEIAKKKKISFYRISKNGGIAQTTLSEIVNGNNLNPTIETSQKIAKGLDVTVTELINKAEIKKGEWLNAKSNWNF